MPHKNIYRRYSVDISGQFMEVPGVQYRSQEKRGASQGRREKRTTVVDWTHVVLYCCFTVVS